MPISEQHSCIKSLTKENKEREEKVGMLQMGNWDTQWFPQKHFPKAYNKSVAEGLIPYSLFSLKPSFSFIIASSTWYTYTHEYDNYHNYGTMLLYIALRMNKNEGYGVYQSYCAFKCHRSPPITVLHHCFHRNKITRATAVCFSQWVWPQDEKTILDFADTLWVMPFMQNITLNSAVISLGDSKDVKQIFRCDSELKMCGGAGFT